MTVQTLRGVQVSGQPPNIELYSHTASDGKLLIQTDRSGGGWYVADLVVRGRGGGYVATVSLTAKDLRILAAAAQRQAWFIDNRAKGLPAPCLCGLGGHSTAIEALCPNLATDDYTMCRRCWVPDGGTQLHHERWHAWHEGTGP